MACEKMTPEEAKDRLRRLATAERCGVPFRLVSQAGLIAAVAGVVLAACPALRRPLVRFIKTMITVVRS